MLDLTIIAVMVKGRLTMATCKECVSYELCEYLTQREALYLGRTEEIYKTIKNHITCKFFKNKSDFQEVNHGKFNDIADFGNGVCFGYCSNCGTEHRAINPSVLKLSYRFCRWCGAKMDGV